VYGRGAFVPRDRFSLYSSLLSRYQDLQVIDISPLFCRKPARDLAEDYRLLFWGYTGGFMNRLQTLRLCIVRDVSLFYWDNRAAAKVVVSAKILVVIAEMHTVRTCSQRAWRRPFSEAVDSDRSLK